ncbi:nurim homolog [Atheta coriaria]|uniref:nurim homolog n=1 Tax=Dalotia coriaria TaxID=877792 RepID=UPI0031F47025
MNTWKEHCVGAFKAGIALTGFLSSFYTMVDLMFFLSNPNFSIAPNKTELSNVSWTWALIMNTLLVSIFALQHSLLAMKPVKDLFKEYGLRDIERSIYIITTSLALELLIKNWHYTHNNVLWQFSTDNHSTYWLYILAHATSWILIYIGSVCMDINELLGLKQIYYSLRGFPDPLNCKSIELRNLYAHMRHPSFIGFIIIFWFVPVMRFDRVLLAAFLSLYMYIAWKTDDMDLNYQKCQISRKFQ